MALNILVPMSGAGSRFEKAGYSFPKPFLDVNGEAMIALVAKNLVPSNREDYQFIFIAQEEHCLKYDLENILKQAIGDKFKIIKVNGITQGAACSALMAKDLINNGDELIVANSDQYIESDFMDKWYKEIKNHDRYGWEGLILCFHSTHPKWSYVRINRENKVIEVAEKKVISEAATAGIYWWKNGSDFVRSTEAMIKKDIRTNNEFYIAPTYNELILEGKHISIGMMDANKMHGLGTPEDLNNYLNR